MSDAIAPVSGQGGTQSTSAAIAVAAVPPAEPTSAQLAPPPAAPASAPSWLEGADEITVGYVQNKGWDNPIKAVDSYRNLEKLLGADKANNAVVIPKADADAKEWAAVYDRLGRPTDPTGYRLAQEGTEPTEFGKMSASKFHELGLSKTQGEQLAAWYNGYAQQQQQAIETQKAQQFQADDLAIKQEWGQAYTQNLAAAQNAARGLGLDAQAIDKLSDALGHKQTLSLLHKIGSRMSEDTFVSGRGESFGNALTPAQAKAQIQSLMSDKDFVTKYFNNDVASKTKMAELHKFAYPE